MAMTARDEIESVAEPVLRRIQPKPVNRDTLDLANAVMSYDRQSDTLLIHLFGRGRASISVPIDRYLYFMVDPETEEIIGIHIEGFISQSVKEHPWQIDILDHAELRGITSGEVQALQRQTLGLRHQIAARVRAAFGRSIAERRKQAIASFLGAESGRWGLPIVPAAS